MWSLHLKSSHSHKPERVGLELRTSFLKAAIRCLFCVASFQIQLLLGLGHEDKAREVAAAATNRFSQLVDMWEMRLQLLLNLQSSEVAACAQEAFKVVKAKVGTLF